MDGDRILIQPGTYFEHSIDFLGKSLELIGVGGAAATTLDGGGADAANLLCQSSTAVTMHVEGLTLRNCRVGIHAATPGTVTVRACVIEDHKNLGLQGVVFDAGVASSSRRSARTRSSSTAWCATTKVQESKVRSISLDV